jgi:hypothetical protein
MSDETPGQVTVRISDPERAEKLLAAEEEHGSRSEAVRQAIDVAYGEETGSSEGLSEAARKAHQKLIEFRGAGEKMSLDAAESIMAQRINLEANVVRKTVTKELVREGLLVVNIGQDGAGAVIRAPDNPASTSKPVERYPHGALERNPRLVANPKADEGSPYRSPGKTETATDGGEARERLDEIAAAERGDHL